MTPAKPGFKFARRRSRPDDIVTNMRALALFHTLMLGEGGRSRIAVVTGYPRRTVARWWIDQHIPPRVCVMLDQVRGLRENGITKEALYPEVLEWPDPVTAAKEFLPNLPHRALRDEVQEICRLHNVPERYSEIGASQQVYLDRDVIAARNKADLLKAQGRMGELTDNDLWLCRQPLRGDGTDAPRETAIIPPYEPPQRPYVPETPKQPHKQPVQPLRDVVGLDEEFGDYDSSAPTELPDY